MPFWHRSAEGIEARQSPDWKIWGPPKRVLLDENDGTKWKLGRSKSKEKSKGSSFSGKTERRLLVFLRAVEKEGGSNIPHTSAALAGSQKWQPTHPRTSRFSFSTSAWFRWLVDAPASMRIWATCTQEKKRIFGRNDWSKKMRDSLDSRWLRCKCQKKITWDHRIGRVWTRSIVLGAWKWWLRRAMETLTTQHLSLAFLQDTLVPAPLWMLLVPWNTKHGGGLTYSLFTPLNLEKRQWKYMKFLGHGVFGGKKLDISYPP